MNALTLPANASITSIDRTIATTITQILSGVTIPMAVMTESSENTISRIAICRMTPPKLTASAVRCLFVPFDLVMDLDDAFADQEQPSGKEDQVADRDGIDCNAALIRAGTSGCGAAPSATASTSGLNQFSGRKSDR